MTNGLVIIGCGGHGREIFGIIRAINDSNSETLQAIGFIDDRPSDLNLARLAQLGAPLLGPLSTLHEMPDRIRYVIGIGHPEVRARVAAAIGDGRKPAAPLVHPTATIGLNNRLGNGTVLFAGARITTNVHLGRHVHINQNATVGHDSKADDFVQINPLAAVSGDCHLQEGVMIGTTAAVLQGLTVGKDAVVGAGACVVRSVPARTVVKGVPAR